MKKAENKALIFFLLWCEGSHDHQTQSLSLRNFKQLALLVWSLYKVSYNLKNERLNVAQRISFFRLYECIAIPHSNTNTLIYNQ